MLYLRMIVFVVVSLYTSRIVLQVLGVEDYGVYSVVGGIILMLGFLNTSLSGSTSRFLIYEMKRSTPNGLKDTFASAFIIHLGLALVVLVIAETVGLYFMSHHLVIDPARMEAAHWVYQLSLLSALLSIVQAPYSACIIAHERMGTYAYIELLNVLLKLGAVFVLQWTQADKLLLYVALLAGISLINLFVYWAYCWRSFAESRFRLVWRKDLLRPMLSFSSWSMLHAASTTGSTQGGNLLLNIFFGTALNAAYAITATVQGILTSFVYNVITAFRPQIIQNCSLEQTAQMERLMLLATMFSVAVFSMLTIPVFAEAEYILQLWLGNVPQFTTIFLRLSLIVGIVTAVSYIQTIAIEAKGAIRSIRLSGTIINCAILPVVYLIFLLGGEGYWFYLVLLFANLMTYAVSLWLFQKYFPEINVSAYVVQTLRPHIFPALLSIAVMLLPRLLLAEGFLRLSLVVGLSVITYLLSFYAISLNSQEQGTVKQWLSQRLKFKPQSRPANE